MTLKRLLGAVLPGLLVVLSAGAALVVLDEATLGAVTGRYALVAYGAGVILAAVFHRSRVVVGLLGLAYLDVAYPDTSVGDGALVLVATVLLVLLGLLNLGRDRGVRSQVGSFQVAGSAAILALAHYVLRDAVAVAAFVDLRLLPARVSELTRLPDAALVASLAALAVSSYGAMRWRGPVERALLWTQVLVLASVHPAVSAAQGSLALMAAGLVLSLSLIEQSYFMAYRDELTGLPGRRALMRDLAEVGGTYTVGMLDVDHFKQFNDKHGHDVGDQVLQLVASRMAKSPDARPYRYGGEEFTLLFPKLKSEDALAGAEVVRVAIEEAKFKLRAWNRPKKRPGNGKPKKKAPKRPRTLSVTVSIGLADSTGKDPSPEAVLKEADQALYRAKSDGRNRVSL